jgi:hypothetical protein
MDITSWIIFTCFLYLIIFILKLLQYSKIFNKHWKFWMYGIYLWLNNTCHKIWKYVCIYIYTWKLGLWVEFVGECFCGEWYWYTSIEYMAIWKFKTFGWKSLQWCGFFHFLNNKCTIIIKNWGKKTLPLRKWKRFYKWTLCYFFNFVCFVMCHEPQTWGMMVIEKIYVIYFMDIDFILSFSSNNWIELKCCHSHFKVFFFWV